MTVVSTDYFGALKSELEMEQLWVVMRVERMVLCSAFSRDVQRVYLMAALLVEKMAEMMVLISVAKMVV